MNKLNPLYIIGILVLFISILSIKISNMQTNINKLAHSIEKTKQIGVYSNDLQNEFANKQKQIKQIKNILKNQKLLSSHKLKITTHSAIIKLENIPSKQTNKVINSIVNSSLFISSLVIQNADHNQTINIKIKL